MRRLDLVPRIEMFRVCLRHWRWPQASSQRLPVAAGSDLVGAEIFASGKWKRFASLTSTEDSESGAPHESIVSKPTDAFRLFSLPYKFHIDEDLLRSTYRGYMKNLHPDMQNQNNTENNPSLGADGLEGALDASDVTNAYQTLHRPHVRAMHLLEILGYPMIEEDKPNVEALANPEFLMEIMELRHEIDATENNDDLRLLFDANVQRTTKTCQALDVAIESHDIASAWKLTSELQYWNRIDETLRDKMDSLEA